MDRCRDTPPRLIEYRPGHQVRCFLYDGTDVTDAATILEDGVRITYHATVLAGVKVGTNSMVGAVAVATKDVRPYHVNVGIPAKSVRVKPNAPPSAYDRLTTVHRDEQ